MKLNDAKRVIETEGFDGTTKTFSIKQSARAFEILSSNIYSDKILAVVREYGCNALDAHRMVGKEDVPFEVHLPNQYEPYFQIRDFGPGLSHEDATVLFTTYFESTKDLSNDFTGCLGLGSKSAFSYVDQFGVTSWNNGVCNTYSAYLNDESVPQITHISSEMSDEPSGVQINIMVKSSDFSSFKERAIKIFKYFPVLPTITGNTFELNKVNYILENELFRVRDKVAYGEAKVYAIQGAVVYPIEHESFNIPMTDRQADFIKYVSGVEIYFDIGGLNITASRERLNYDKVTQRNILNKIDAVAARVNKDFNDKIALAKNLYEAKKIYHEINNSSIARVYRGSQVTFKGKEISTDLITIDVANKVPVMMPDGVTQECDKFGRPLFNNDSFFNIVEYDRYTIENHRSLRGVVKDLSTRVDASRLSTNTNGEITIAERSNPITYLIFDDTVGVKRNLPALIKYNFQGNSANVHIFVPTKEDSDLDKLHSILEGYPKENILLLSQLEPVPKAVKVKSTTTKADAQPIRKAYKINSRSDGTFNKQEVDKDMAEGGIYFLTYSGAMVKKGVALDAELTNDCKYNNSANYHQLMAALASMHYGPRFSHELSFEVLQGGPKIIDGAIYFINSTHKSQIKDNPLWVDGYKLLDEAIAKFTKVTDDELASLLTFVMLQDTPLKDVYSMSLLDGAHKSLLPISNEIFGIVKLLVKLGVLNKEASDTYKEWVKTVSIYSLMNLVKDVIKLITEVIDYTYDERNKGLRYPLSVTEKKYPKSVQLYELYVQSYTSSDKEAVKSASISKFITNNNNQYLLVILNHNSYRAERLTLDALHSILKPTLN